jgi:protein SCO1/2
MDRRNFLGLGLGLGLAPMVMSTQVLATQVPSKPPSRAASSGFLPNVPLITHEGENVMFYDDLVRDKIVLLNFFLMTCSEGRCPIAMANLRRVQDLLGDRMGRDIFFLSVTLRPELERPKGLKAYAQELNVKPGWLFLTGNSSDIETLRRGTGYVDPDPERDRDLSNHIGMARYGDDKLDRWGAVSLRSSASNIASTFKWLSQS